MNKYNMPLNELTELSLDDYETCKQFFTYCLTSESRQIHYNNNFLQGSMNFRIFWVSEEQNLGFAFCDDWKAKKVRFYRIGSDENWTVFNRGFGARFVGDHS